MLSNAARIVLFSGYAILQLPDFFRALYLKMHDILSKRRARNQNENTQLKSFVIKESVNTKIIDVEKVTKQKIDSDFLQYLSLRIQLIHDFQHHNAHNEARVDSPMKLENFLTFEKNALKKIIREN